MESEEIELEEVSTVPYAPGHPLAASPSTKSKSKRRRKRKKEESQGEGGSDDVESSSSGGEEVSLREFDGVGIVLSEEPLETDATPQSRWKAFYRFFLPEKGKLMSYILGIAFDISLFLIWLILIFVLTSNDTITREDVEKTWYMPLLGIVGATVAMSTPAGGGVFYFPALTLLSVSAKAAISFNYATQVTGMGIFGTFHWVRKSYSSIMFWVIGWVTIWGWGGSVLTMMALRISEAIVLRIIFAVFSFLLLCYVVYGLKKGTLKSQDKPVERNWKTMIVFAITGFLGGMMLGWISVGIDTFIFFVLTAVYKVDSRKATVTSILVIGWTSLVPLLFHMFYFKDVPYLLWLMVSGGSIIGARVGPLLNKLVGRKIMMILFVIMLAGEVIRTFIELVVLPNFKRPI